MINILLKIYYKLLEYKIRKAKTHIIIGQNTRIDGMRVELRNPSINKQYLSIGENSIVHGKFVFENPSGNVKVGNNTFIGASTFMCINSIEIGSDVLISWGCTILDNNSHPLEWSHRKDDVRLWKKGMDEQKFGIYKDWTHVKNAPIVIKNKAWIGFNCIITKGVTIGEGSIVASGSVVTKNVPDWTVVGGNPAQVIKNISENER